jgi:hypothetical protein
MKDLIRQLNSIDVGAWFKKVTKPKSAQMSANPGSSGGSSALSLAADRLLQKIDKKLFITVGLAVILITWGISSVFDSFSKRAQVSELELTLSQLDSENLTLAQQLNNLKTNNKTLFESAKNSPASANELLSRVSDIYGRAGMSVLKVSTGTADKPEFIQIDAEGAFRSIQYVLAELLKLSSVIDVKLLQFNSDANKGTLQMSIGMQFVKPPKISMHPKDDHSNYAYLDGADHPKLNKQIQLVQFVPQKPAAASPAPAAQAPAPAAAPAPAPAAPAPANNSSALDRNPFYIPTNPSSTGGASAQSSVGGAVDFGRGMGATPSPVRGEGIHVTGCMVSKGKKACLIQLNDGSSGVFSVGQAINKDLKLVDIQPDIVTVQLSGKLKKIKVGEQVQ